MVLVNTLYERAIWLSFCAPSRGEKRLEINDKDLHFSFGDWYRFPAAHSMTASMLTATSELGGWWDDRLVRMYGMNYAVSRDPTRGGQQEMFTGKMRHQDLAHSRHVSARLDRAPDILAAPNDSAAADMVHDANGRSAPRRR
jgi:hypothetical protein